MTFVDCGFSHQLANFYILKSQTVQTFFSKQKPMLLNAALSHIACRLLVFFFFDGILYGIVFWCVSHWIKADRRRHVKIFTQNYRLFHWNVKLFALGKCSLESIFDSASKLFRTDRSFYVLSDFVFFKNTDWVVFLWCTKKVHNVHVHVMLMLATITRTSRTLRNQ